MSSLVITQYIRSRFDFKLWIIVALLLLAPSFVGGWSKDLIDKFVVTMLLLFAFRILDDILCTEFEKNKGQSRIYHAKDVQKKLLICAEVLFLFAVTYFSENWFFYLLSLTFTHIIYYALKSTPLVKWVFILKYPLIIYLMSHDKGQVTLVYAIYIMLIFFIRELHEENISSLSSIWIIPQAFIYLMIPRSHVWVLAYLGLSSVVLFLPKIPYNGKFLILCILTIFYLTGSL